MFANAIYFGLDPCFLLEHSYEFTVSSSVHERFLHSFEIEQGSCRNRLSFVSTLPSLRAAHDVRATDYSYSRTLSSLPPLLLGLWAALQSDHVSQRSDWLFPEELQQSPL